MPNNQNNSFVELNRRFRKLARNERPEEEAIKSYTDTISGGVSGLGWDEVLAKDRVVVLGEPGSGKSWEMHERTRLLVAAGKFAFFIRLDLLVTSPLQSILHETERRRWQNWKESSQYAYLFLDSVDEAKFHRNSDFLAALTKIRTEVGEDRLIRLKLFLSSRISEWKPSTDGFDLRNVFPIGPAEKRATNGLNIEKEKPEEEFLVVQIEPLETHQIECLARAKGLENVPAFLSGLDKAFAWEFARRPLDVSDLISFWKANQQIGSLSELIKFDVAAKLRPREGKDELPLSLEDAYEGAKWLAAASFFCRKFSFAVPDDETPDSNCLAPRDCLPQNWDDRKIRALLSRAIFDSAAYGRIRFHHRRVGEYLAAEWVKSRIDNGCTSTDLEALLTQSVRGQQQMRPSLRPIAAWLCIGKATQHQVVRKLTLKLDPRVHLAYGDPAALDLDYKRDLLHELARWSTQRGEMGIEPTLEDLGRVSDPRLANLIAEMIADHSLGTDFRGELLDIVNSGHLAACGPATLGVALSEPEPAHLRIRAIRAIGKIGDKESQLKMIEAFSKASEIPNRLFPSIAECLYPHRISTKQFVQLLAKTGHVRRHSLDLPYYLDSYLKKCLSVEEAPLLLHELVELATQEPWTMVRDKPTHVSSRFYWIGRVIPTLLEIILAKPNLSTQEIDDVAESLEFLGNVREFDHYHYDEVGENVNELTLHHPQVRRELLWRIVMQFRKEHNDEPHYSGVLFHYHDVMSLRKEDLKWLISDISEKTEPNDRLLSLRLAIEIWNGAGRSVAEWWQMRKIAAKELTLRNEFQKSPVTRALFPIKRYWHWEIKHKFSRIRWLHKKHLLSQKWNFYRDQIYLLRHLGIVKSGDRTGWLANLSREADEENHDHWAPSKWSDLEKKRGKRIAEAVKQGCKTAWKRHVPQLPHEKPESNRTDTSVIIGLAGLQVEFEEEGKNLTQLTDEEAKLAARYAMDELNGFPKWLGRLAIAKPNAVTEVLDECLEAEWQFRADRSNVYEVTSKLMWGGSALTALAQEKLLSLITKGDPPNHYVRHLAVTALIQQQDPPLARLAQLAEQRAKPENGAAAIAFWLAVWMQFDAKGALDRLDAVTADQSSMQDVFQRLCSTLSGERGERGPLLSNPNYLAIPNLRRFIPIVFKYVSPADDLDHGGEAYTPTARDDAERFRNFLLSRLEAEEDPKATDALRELADESLMAPVRDWILRMLEKRLLKEADAEPWQPADLHDFSANFEVAPKSTKELFGTIIKRLTSIKWDVEFADNSLREELREGDEEAKLRRWLQRKLYDRAKGRYTVPQEGEIDLKQRPDLRIENPNMNPVSIEVKWADNWTLAELLERLENQLVGQYMRAHNSNYGVYFLGFIGNKNSWQGISGSGKLAFGEVVRIIREKAASLMSTNPNALGLEITEIDFRDPRHIPLQQST